MKFILEITNNRLDEKAYLINGDGSKTPILFWKLKIDDGEGMMEWNRFPSLKIRNDHIKRISKDKT